MKADTWRGAVAKLYSTDDDCILSCATHTQEIRALQEVEHSPTPVCSHLGKCQLCAD